MTQSIQREAGSSGSISQPAHEAVVEALRRVDDPELGVNVVDLGLVRAVEIEGGRVRVRMIMTSPACPVGASIAWMAEATIRGSVPGADDVEVEIVDTPRWEPSMMTDEARQRLGWRAT